MKKLFIVVNVDWFFLSHRLPIALEAIRRGYDVTVLAIEEEGKGEEIRNHGIKFIPLPATRGGSNIFAEISLLRFLMSVYKEAQPDIVHHVAIKPVIYGSLAARWNNVPVIVNAISGFGSVFIKRKNVSPANALVRRLYRYALKDPRIRIIVQNQDDYNFVSTFKGIQPGQLFLIKGSGVDLSSFPYCKPKDQEVPMVLMASRMLYDKGVKELVSAAKEIIKYRNVKATFILAGKLDAENKSGIPEEKLLEWNREGYVKWIGHQEDMLRLYIESAIVVLPSYREGLPKTLIEACAIGRPIVTTNVPGCREVVQHGVNGLLVEKENTTQLADAIFKLLTDDKLRESMGLKAREIAEKEFSIDRVIDKTFEVYVKA